MFDEILSKFWLYKNNFGSLGTNLKITSGQILNVIWSQIIVFYLFLVTDTINKDTNFIHLTPFICSMTS